MDKYTVALEIAEGWDRDGVLTLENGVVPKWRKLVASLLTNRALQNQKLMEKHVPCTLIEVPCTNPAHLGKFFPSTVFGTWVLADK